MVKYIGDFSGAHSFLDMRSALKFEYQGVEYISIFEALNRQDENLIDCKESKLNTMYNIVWDLFSNNSELSEKLISTGDNFLIYNNKYGDDFWGIYNGEGRNMYGFILVNIRSRLIKIKNNNTDDILESEYIELLSKNGIKLLDMYESYNLEILQKIIEYYGSYDIFVRILDDFFCEDEAVMFELIGYLLKSVGSEMVLSSLLEILEFDNLNSKENNEEPIWEKEIIYITSLTNDVF